MIGQFSRLYFTVQTTNFKSLFKLKSSSSIWTQRCNKYHTNLIFFSHLKQLKNWFETYNTELLQTWLVKVVGSMRQIGGLDR